MDILVRLLLALALVCLFAGCTGNDADPSVKPITTLAVFQGDATLERAIEAFDDCVTPPTDAFDEISAPPSLRVLESAEPGGLLELEWVVEEMFLYAYDYGSVSCWTGDDWSFLYFAFDIKVREATAKFGAEFASTEPQTPYGPGEISWVKIPAFAKPGSYLFRLGTMTEDGNGQIQIYFEVEQ